MTPEHVRARLEDMADDVWRNNLPRRAVLQKLESAYTMGLSRGVSDERERCAKIAMEKHRDPAYHSYLGDSGEAIAAAIRSQEVGS